MLALADEKDRGQWNCATCDAETAEARGCSRFGFVRRAGFVMRPGAGLELDHCVAEYADDGIGERVARSGWLVQGELFGVADLFGCGLDELPAPDAEGLMLAVNVAALARREQREKKE